LSPLDAAGRTPAKGETDHSRSIAVRTFHGPGARRRLLRPSSSLTMMITAVLLPPQHSQVAPAISQVRGTVLSCGVRRVGGRRSFEKTVTEDPPRRHSVLGGRVARTKPWRPSKRKRLSRGQSPRCRRSCSPADDGREADCRGPRVQRLKIEAGRRQLSAHRCRCALEYGLRSTNDDYHSDNRLAVVDGPLC